MRPVVADTHAVVWYLSANPKLSEKARSAMDEATLHGHPILVPTICIVELTYLVEKNRVEPGLMARLAHALIQPEAAMELVPLSSEIAFAVRRIDRAAVPDFPDRIIAATSLSLGLPLITCDAKIQQSGVSTIW